MVLLTRRTAQRIRETIALVRELRVRERLRSGVSVPAGMLLDSIAAHAEHGDEPLLLGSTWTVSPDDVVYVRGPAPEAELDVRNRFCLPEIDRWPQLLIYDQSLAAWVPQVAAPYLIDADIQSYDQGTCTGEASISLPSRQITITFENRLGLPIPGAPHRALLAWLVRPELSGTDPMGGWVYIAPVEPCEGSSGQSESSIVSESSRIESSRPSEGSERSSYKSSAIVPVPWSPTGYVALFILEAPEVRFDDVMVAVVPQIDQALPIDERYSSVCEPGTIEVCGVACDVPVAVGAQVIDDEVYLRFSPQDADVHVRVVLRLTGIRRGYQGVRFPRRTRRQFEANEQFIRSAYPDDPEAE